MQRSGQIHSRSLISTCQLQIRLRTWQTLKWSITIGTTLTLSIRTFVNLTQQWIQEKLLERTLLTNPRRLIPWIIPIKMTKGHTLRMLQSRREPRLGRKAWPKSNKRRRISITSKFHRQLQCRRTSTCPIQPCKTITWLRSSLPKTHWLRRRKRRTIYPHSRCHSRTYTHLFKRSPNLPKSPSMRIQAILRLMAKSMVFTNSTLIWRDRHLNMEVLTHKKSQAISTLSRLDRALWLETWDEQEVQKSIKTRFSFRNLPNLLLLMMWWKLPQADGNGSLLLQMDTEQMVISSHNSLQTTCRSSLNKTRKQ